MSKRWYVLQVTSGKEIEIKNQLERKGYKILVPIVEKQIRQKGVWKKHIDVIFNGYIFVKLDYKWCDYYNLCKFKNVIRILGGGQFPLPLSNDEIINIRKLDMLREISKVKFHDNKLIPLSGILLEFKDCLINYKRRQRRAIIELTIAKTKTQVAVYFIEVL